MRWILVYLSFFACTSTPVIHHAQEHHFLDSITVNEFYLPNGLRVLHLEDHTSPTFAYQTWYEVGSRDEVEGYTGLAHLFEHMMFKKTKNLKEGEFDQQLDRLGALGLNAFTSKDYTAYIIELPKTHLKKIAELEAERMVNLIVDESALNIERKVVQDERRFRVENNPQGLILQQLLHNLFPDHPYRFPVIGTKEDLNQITAKDAMSFYKKYYQPGRATIVIVGDLSLSEVQQTLYNAYAHIPGKRSPDYQVENIPFTALTAPKREVLPLEIQTEFLALGFQAPHILHEDVPKLELLQALLTDGEFSRLNNALVNTTLATTVTCGNWLTRSPGIFIFFAQMQQGKRAVLAEEIILRELQKIKTQGISHDELTRAKNIVQFQLFSGLVSNSEKARFLGSFTTTAGSFKRGEHIYQQISKVTPEDIQAVVGRYFTPEKRVTIEGRKK